MEHDRLEDESNGQRLARVRKARGLTQKQLAARVDYTLGTIKSIEQGRRSLDRGQMILAFARALDCHPSELMGSPFAVPQNDRDGQVANAAVAAIHRALLVHGRPPRVTDAEVTAVDLVALRERAAEAARYRHHAALARSAQVLPSLLRDLQVAALVSAGDAQREAYDLLASGYESAMQLVYKMGHGAVSTLATERTLWSTQQTEDPLRILSARWYEAGEFIAVGEHDVAANIIDEALVELGGFGDSSPQAVSLRGAFELKGALNSARATDATGADMFLRRAQHTAQVLGEDRDDYELLFGPSNVEVWSIGLPLEFGRGREAVRRAESIKLPPTFAKERRCHFHIDLGRGHWYNGQRDKALASFLEAERIAPQQTRMHSAVRETVRTMIKTQRRGALYELGLRVGVM